MTRWAFSSRVGSESRRSESAFAVFFDSCRETRSISSTRAKKTDVAEYP